jgi:hypothetical protein
MAFAIDFVMNIDVFELTFHFAILSFSPCSRVSNQAVPRLRIWHPETWPQKASSLGLVRVTRLEQRFDNCTDT